MKKILTLLILFSVIMICLEINKNSLETKSVMDYISLNDSYYEYNLNFDKEILNLENFKLKLATFTSYNYQIKKIYPSYDEKYKEYFKNKEYFIFNSTNLNDCIDNIREEYLNIIKKSNLEHDIDSITDNYIIIKKVNIYTSEESINKFKIKYPTVTIDRIDYNK